MHSAEYADIGPRAGMATDNGKQVEVSFYQRNGITLLKCWAWLIELSGMLNYVVIELSGMLYTY